MGVDARLEPCGDGCVRRVCSAGVEERYVIAELDFESKAQIRLDPLLPCTTIIPLGTKVICAVPFLGGTNIPTLSGA